MLLQRGETHAPRLVPSYCITFSASEVVPLTACTDPVHWDRREFLRTAGDGSVDQAEHVIRWRHGERDQRQSNSRLVEWSDGSMTLHVGTEAIFQVVQVAQPLAAPGLRYMPLRGRGMCGGEVADAAGDELAPPGGQAGRGGADGDGGRGGRGGGARDPDAAADDEEPARLASPAPHAPGHQQALPDQRARPSPAPAALARSARVVYTVQTAAQPATCAALVPALFLCIAFCASRVTTGEAPCAAGGGLCRWTRRKCSSRSTRRGPPAPHPRTHPNTKQALSLVPRQQRPPPLPTRPFPPLPPALPHPSTRSLPPALPLLPARPCPRGRGGPVAGWAGMGGLSWSAAR